METTINSTIEDAKGVAFAVPGVRQMVAVAHAGVQLGLGLAAMALEGAQKIGGEALSRGAVIERKGMEKATEIERESVEHMKSFVKMAGAKKSNASIEAKIEQALATFDVPTREDIRELHMHIAAVSDKLNHLAGS